MIEIPWYVTPKNSEITAQRGRIGNDVPASIGLPAAREPRNIVHGTFFKRMIRTVRGFSPKISLGEQSLADVMAIGSVAARRGSGGDSENRQRFFGFGRPQAMSPRQVHSGRVYSDLPPPGRKGLGMARAVSAYAPF